MNTIAVVLIIIFVLAIIASNIALIRYSNKFQLPPSDQHDKDPEQTSSKQQSQDDEKSPK